MLKSLEHHEHAEHIAHAAPGGDGHGSGGESNADLKKSHRSAQLAALLVAVLAAGLALSEQGAKHAEIRVEEGSIAAADAWSQYQAKSTRATISKDVADLITVLDVAPTPDAVARREKVLDGLKRDQERYRRDPQDGMEAISHRAHEFEHGRNHALEETHAYHNGSAAMELGIVLATASAIIGSKLLIRLAVVVGASGAVFALLGLLRPEWGAF